MASKAASALSILLLSIAAVFWVTALPTVQAGTNALRRDLFYGTANPDFFVGYLDDHGAIRPKTTQTEQRQQQQQLPSRLVNAESVTPMKGNRYLRYEEDMADRLERNLDQIGGGNLLRRGLQEERNLDQIGGGNLLREVDAERLNERNLDQIGGGNLVRGLDGVMAAADHFRRNLDQIGGGNLVRSLSEIHREMDSPRLRDGQDIKDVAAGDRRIRPSARIRYARRGIDFPLFVEDASSDDSLTVSNSNSLAELSPADRVLFEQFVKRNIDEIDRTAFDNFFKRKLDEIDRVDWNGFVKRFAHYLTTTGTWSNRPKSRG
ncbi:PREDICTED: uncharacterized protein LOC108574852 [Habropoda laboriosa]|uniref:uncharacterized protein LOC108574852 n=1 Tax=Habropoda laboriosa TaxID=597456 RepID=UPI00083DBBDA|nr:PREDICTED: uncharacterized protein LOC108574852 [Habropoda laboriosa]